MSEPVRFAKNGEACTECDEIVEWLHERRGIGQRLRLRAHGPRGARCPGSYKPGKGWLATSRLPQWSEMSDLDKGIALMHAWKCYWERDARYARENYPAAYLNHPRLTALDPSKACRHALAATGGHVEALRSLGDAEHRRLYELAEGRDRVSFAGGAS